MSYANQPSTQAHAYSAYRQVQDEVVDQRHLVVVLFEGVLRLLQEGRRHLASGSYEGWADRSNRVRRIFSELLLALDDQQAPELCGSLRALYVYLQRLITEAGLEDDPDKLQEAISLVSQLGTAWKEANTACRSQSV